MDKEGKASRYRNSFILSWRISKENVLTKAVTLINLQQFVMDYRQCTFFFV